MKTVEACERLVLGSWSVFPAGTHYQFRPRHAGDNDAPASGKSARLRGAPRCDLGALSRPFRQPGWSRRG